MRGINEKTLLAVRKSLAAKGLNTDVTNIDVVEWAPFTPETWAELNKDNS